MSFAPSLDTLRISRLFALCTTLSLPAIAAAAPEGASAVKRLSSALVVGEADAINLTWTRGAKTDGAYQKLRIEAGRVALEKCEASCATVGTPFTMSSGEKSQLISRLRGAELASLRDSDAEVSADRQLELAVSGSSVGQWRLPRAEWPVPPDGYGLADYLDDLSKRIERTTTVRPPLPVPSTIAELHSIRLQLRLQPRLRPGGLLVVEQGKLRVTPEEGSLARTPRPKPFERSLTADEETSLLAALKSAKLDELDAAVEKRGQPAIGDSDGRIATLHLLPLDATSTDKKAVAYQPRGYERYLADLQRSSAGPLLGQLLGWLVSDLAEGKAAPSPPPPGRGTSRHPTQKH